ncbi:MAG: Rv2993c-like domain-containing protein, partial [Bacillus sp. (in: firmicutes)]
MGINVVRFEHKQKEQWGVVSGDQIRLLSGTYQSLADFLEHGKEEAR